MSDAGVRWQMHVYGGVRHSFTNATLEGRDIAGLAYDRTLFVDLGGGTGEVAIASRDCGSGAASATALKRL